MSRQPSAASYTPLGLFSTFTLAEILAIRDQAKAQILQGKTIMAYTDSGTSISKEFSITPAQALIECNHTLSSLDPKTYPAPKRSCQSCYHRGSMPL